MIFFQMTSPDVSEVFYTMKKNLTGIEKKMIFSPAENKFNLN
jgi:hypothetical protein